ncbi:MAG: hypothetical protein M0C28_19065 [Candidatus Moduliflexus flocculans]|nr:hypothetical protein [Candidatus Moduliflexus flocculans]
MNGVLTATVNAASYDFTSLTGDSLLFTVVAVGPTGYEDSVPSASIAYVANPALVIAAITAVAEGEDMTLPDGVAAELVRKGITGPIFQSDIDAVQDFQTAMEASEGDMSIMNDALTAFVGEVDNYEAYLSAFLLIAPDMIDDQIASEEENRSYYEDMLDVYPGDEYYLSRIDEINQQIEMLTNMQTAIEENRDQMLVTVVAVIDYLLSFHEQITVDLINQIEAIAGRSRRHRGRNRPRQERNHLAPPRQPAERRRPHARLRTAGRLGRRDERRRHLDDRRPCERVCGRSPHLDGNRDPLPRLAGRRVRRRHDGARQRRLHRNESQRRTGDPLHHGVRRIQGRQRS